MAQTFDVDLLRLGAVSEALREALKAERATDKEIRQTLLLVEEITVKFTECMPEAPVTAKVQRSFGKLSVSLSAVGPEHDPISETQNWSAGTEDYYRTLILRANKHLLNYHRVEGKNVVTIHVHTEEKKYIVYSFVALVCGLVLGLLMHVLLSASTVEWLEANVFSLIERIFMNAMAAMVVPAVFCAVVDSITSLSSLQDTGRMGGRIMRLYSLTTIIAILVGFVLAVPTFTHFLSDNYLLGAAADEAFFDAPSLREFILTLVPAHLVEPILSGNMPQVLLLAVVTGVAMGIVGEKSEPLRRLIAALNQVFQTIIAIIALIVPILTFIATASLAARFAFKPLPMILLLVLVELVGCTIMFVVYNIMIRLFGGLKARPYARKTFRFFRRVNPRASSGEYLPKVVGLCTNQLGVSERVASFSAALGASVNMDGSAIHMVVCSVLMAQLFGVKLTPNTMALIAIMAFFLSGGAAAVQNSGMLSVSTLAVMLGIPTSGIALLFGAAQLRQLVVTPTPQMHCQSCENKIKNQLALEKGVQKVVTNLTDQTVTVTYNARKTNKETIIKSLGEVGYTCKVVKDVAIDKKGKQHKR
ncbi:MAG: cation:dicarboxylase symporter family transporter [Oscillospiraceae bacterium]|nr:cation:dicarboxylase symporter family transporter [Oscillospiraceae bacterium]